MSHRFAYYLVIGVALIGCEPHFDQEPASTDAELTDTLSIDEIVTPPGYSTTSPAPTPLPLPEKQAGIDYQRINWADLIPADELAILLNPPDYINDISDGSSEDQLISQMQSPWSDNPSDPYQQALVSTNIIPTMANKAITLPGFIVPLTFGDDPFTVTQFFLVPFFGACLHLPPPPPNQILFIDYPKGITLTELYYPFWVSGILNTQLTSNDTATSAYQLELHHLAIYEDEE